MLFAASVTDGGRSKEEGGVPTAVAVHQPPVAELMQEPYHEASAEVFKFYQVGGWVRGTGPDMVGARPLDRRWIGRIVGSIGSIERGSIVSTYPNTCAGGAKRGPVHR